MKTPTSKWVMVRPDTFCKSNDSSFTHSFPARNFSPKTIGRPPVFKLKISRGSLDIFEYLSTRSCVSAFVSEDWAPASEGRKTEISNAIKSAQGAGSFVLSIAGASLIDFAVMDSESSDRRVFLIKEIFERNQLQA